MVKRSIITAMILGFSGFSALAQTADPRAIEACKKSSQAFTEIASCLPTADVAIMTLDAFGRIFPEAAKPLADKCVQLNGNDIAGAATCVTEAVQSAIDLKRRLPADVDLDDPLFAAVADAALMDELDRAIEAARARYPDERIWGGRMYRPYK